VRLAKHLDSKGYTPKRLQEILSDANSTHLVTKVGEAAKTVKSNSSSSVI